MKGSRISATQTRWRRASIAPVIVPVDNGGGSAHELVGGAVDGCGASLLFVIPSASAGVGTTFIPAAGGRVVAELALCGSALQQLGLVLQEDDAQGRGLI